MAEETAVMQEKMNKLKLLLGLDVEDTSKDVFVQFAIETAEELVRNYCHIEEIPEGLASTLLRIAMEIYRNEQPGVSEVPQAVKSIETGDTKTSFAVTETTGYSESILKDYKKQLNRYRKVEF